MPLSQATVRHGRPVRTGGQICGARGDVGAQARIHPERAAQVVTHRGTVERMGDCHDCTDASANDPNGSQPPPCDGAMRFCGLSLRASVRVEANDDRGHDRLFPYCLRRPCSLRRLGMSRDGRVLYRAKESRRRASRMRIVTPLGSDCA